jgi:hypothetical protein
MKLDESIHLMTISHFKAFLPIFVTVTNFIKVIGYNVPHFSYGEPCSIDHGKFKNSEGIFKI